MESTIISFLQRIRTGFTTRAEGESAEYRRGGNAALEIAKQEFEQTTLYNLQQQLAQTQAELERISEDLSRARLQNRLQTAELERLNKMCKGRLHKHTIQAREKELNNKFLGKLHKLVNAASEQPARLNTPPLTAEEHLQRFKTLLGHWLRNYKPMKLVEEETEVLDGVG